MIIEENNNESVKSLLNILKGPSIPNTHFSNKITFFALTIMRALMHYSALPKILFMEDHAAISAVLNVLKQTDLTEQTELCIYSFVTSLIKDEQDYKRIIGKKLLSICHAKLQIQTGREVLNSNCEQKFFKMLAILLKRCNENINMMKGDMKDRMFRYRNMATKDQWVRNKIDHILHLVDNFIEDN